MIGFLLGLVVGCVVGWLCAFFLWPTSLYAKLLVWFERLERER